MKRLLLLLLLVSISLYTHAQIITTIAGTGVLGYSGDNATATAAKINAPHGITLDGHGNIFFADFGNSLIRKIDNAGIITTIAGIGGTGYNGDSILATNAQLYGPNEIAIDKFDNIYFADYGNDRIRKIDTFGIITTVAGSVYGYGGDSGLATSALLADPEGVAVDTVGNIYIADAGNNRIRMINAAGIIFTIAGTGVAGFTGDSGLAVNAKINLPFSVDVDKRGDVFFSDNGNNRVRKFNPFTDGLIHTIAGNGVVGFNGDSLQATIAELNGPACVRSDGVGNIYLADASNNRIRKVDTFGVIATIAGNGTGGYGGDNGPPILCELYSPVGVAINSVGNIYIGDNANSRIREIRYNVGVANVSNTASAIAVYPSPSLGRFTIQLLADLTEHAQITITDMMGERVCELSGMTNEPIEVQLHVAPGLYFISAATANTFYTGKVTISE